MEYTICYIQDCFFLYFKLTKSLVLGSQRHFSRSHVSLSSQLTTNVQDSLSHSNLRFWSIYRVCKCTYHCGERQFSSRAPSSPGVKKKMIFRGLENSTIWYVDTYWYDLHICKVLLKNTLWFGPHRHYNFVTLERKKENSFLIFHICLLCRSRVIKYFDETCVVHSICVDIPIWLFRNYLRF